MFDTVETWKGKFQNVWVLFVIEYRKMKKH